MTPFVRRGTRLARLSRFAAAAVLAGCGEPPSPVAAAPPPASSPPAPSSSEPARVSFVPPAPTDRIDVAITVDDLPRHGPDVPGVTREAIHRRMLEAFAAHHVPPVTGFINGERLALHPEDAAALEAWVAAGNPLGNHSWSHPDPKDLSIDAYLADVDRNEDVLRRFMPRGDERAWKVYRFPFLREGTDTASRATLHDALRARGYRVAPVTIDFYDWAYHAPHARCLEKNDEGAIAGLRESYIDEAAAALRWADAAGRELFGRPTKQILLLHIGHFSSLMMDQLLSTYEKVGARFITLDDALSDEAISGEIPQPKTHRGTHFNQVRWARGTRSPVMQNPQDTLLELVCR